MNNILPGLLLSIVFTFPLQAQPLTVGDEMVEFSIPLIDDDTYLTSTDTEGKVLLLDFWATWCGPCIQGMDQYQRLLETYPDQLLVAAISEESPERLQRFRDNKSFTFFYGLDTSQVLREYFPYRTIPHAVLINPAGEVVAITQPEYITDEVIEAILVGDEVALPQKKDNVDFNYADDYFQLDSATQTTFIVQPSIPGVSTFSVRHQGVFKDRRLSLMNFAIDGLYRMAYQTTVYRMDYEVSKSRFDYNVEDNKYCVTLVVAEGKEDQLYPEFQQRLAETFDVQARLQTRKTSVIVIDKLNPDEFLPLETSANHVGLQRGGGDRFISEGATIADFAQYLESYGITGRATIDQSSDDTLYVFDFHFDPENPQSFEDALAEIGLTYRREIRPIETLVIYDPAIQ